MSHIPEPDQAPLGTRGRVLLAGLGLLLVGGFALAAALRPDRRGYGTHCQLGLPSCTMRLLYGIPCPTCGMTTSFAHFVRGRFIESARSNAGGFLLALLCAAAVPWCWAGAWRGRLLWFRRLDLPAVWALLAVLALAAVQWVMRVV